jgi:hypothetical protein
MIMKGAMKNCIAPVIFDIVNNYIMKIIGETN